MENRTGGRVAQQDRRGAVHRSLDELYLHEARQSSDTRRSYVEKLETASEDKIFLHYLLANLSAHVELITQARLQAQESFQWSKRVAIFGFIGIFFGVVYAVVSTINEWGALAPAYLSALAGIVAEFISGIFFFLYTNTIKQVNLVRGDLQESKTIALAALMNERIQNTEARDAAHADISKRIITNSGLVDMDHVTAPVV